MSGGFDIAIVGMAGRFPGARSVEELWRNLAGGVESIRFFSEEELRSAGVDASTLDNPDYVKANGVLDGVELFDAPFFGFTAREAEITDPQHRLFLECAWEALEDAAHDPETFGRPIGVYAGLNRNTYSSALLAHPEILRAVGGFQAIVSNDRDFLSTRVSYKLNLTGPSVVLQTACSTSLVAVHFAIQGLLSGDCDLALAGGVSVLLPQDKGYHWVEGGIYSPDGHCRAFDARARGTLSGNGLGVVVLKRLDEALDEGDHVYAVIKGTAINNDGALKIGYTAPSVEGQSKVIRAAQAVAGIDPETIAYVEAHGTGTPLGDPIEIAALRKAFRSEAKRFCAIGSIKTNFGHLDTAAGIAGLIKATLALDRRQIPPSLHFEEPNPETALADSPFYVNTELRPWPAGGAPRRAGVSSFGIGGTNAHAVLEEAPPPAPSSPSRPWQLLVLSARTAPALDRLAENLAGHLEAHPEARLADVAYTCHLGRKLFEHRRAVVCSDSRDAAAVLRGLDPQRVLDRRYEGSDRPVVFGFPGQGSQHAGMAWELLAEEPSFREPLELCFRILGLDPETLQSAEALERTEVAQPVLFGVEYALARLWMDWGARPEAMIGHSLGEYVAACLSGVFSIEEGLALVAERGRLMQGLPAGAMLAVPVSEEEIEPLLRDDLGNLELATVNGPAQCVVSGTLEAVERLESELKSQGRSAKRLPTSHAFHSRMMDPVLEAFGREVRKVRLRPPQIPFLSNLTGTWIEPSQATDPDYWVQHLRRPVRFGQGLEELLAEPGRAFLEVGPGRTLGSLIRRHPRCPPEMLVLSSMPSRDDADSESKHLLTSLGRLCLAGVKVDWPGFYAHERRRKLSLPTYPFERRRYWLDLPRGTSAAKPVETAAEEERPSDPAPPPVAKQHSRPDLSTAYVAPRDEPERLVAEVWEQLLGVEPVGAQDNFFEMGGHSLLAIQVAARLRDRLSLDLPMSELFKVPTVAGMASVVAAQAPTPREEAATDRPALQGDPEHLDEPFPLTDVQQAYWLGRGGQFELGNVATHTYLEIDHQELDLERLGRVWRRLIDRHGMLRAVVLPDGSQRILPEVPPYVVETLDVRGLPLDEAKRRIGEVRQRMSHQVLPSDRWPLFELRASVLDEGRVRLHVSFDYLIGDAWSWEILLAELSRLYREPDCELPALEISFRDYVLAELAFRASREYQRSAEYWRARYATLAPAPELPLARSPREVEKPRFVRRGAILARERWSRLKARATVAGLTPSSAVLAAFSEALAAWSRSPRFTLNLTLFNRLPVHAHVNDLVGDFTSLTLLEVDGEGGTFEERARRIQERLWSDLDHRHFSGVQVSRELARVRGRSAAAMPIVFTSTLNMSAAGRDGAAEPGSAGQMSYGISQTPQVHLDHQVSEWDGALRFNWDAVEDLFPQGLLDDLFAAYSGLLERLADEPSEEDAWGAESFNLVPAAQLALQARVNATAEPLSRELLQTLVSARARTQPDHPAVVSGERVLSYGELERRSTRLGRRLRELGARPNELVAVAMEKGWEQVVAVLAVLKSGAAYLPVDPALPPDRVRLLLEQGEARWVLTQPWLDLPLPPGMESLVVEAEEPGDAEPLAPVQGPRDLAYVIFTSGSTGTPKGVMIEHEGAVNTVLDVNRRFGIGPGDRVLALSSLSFDLSVWDVFGVLSAGGTLVMPDPAGLRDPAHWAERMERWGVTLWNTVPALMEMLTQYASGRSLPVPGRLRLAMMSGDWIGLDLPDRVRRLWPGVEVVSLGGATEASIWSILYPIGEVGEGWKSIPYGRPMVNQTFQVLDGRLEPRPFWVPGDLHIGGAGLARGYWRDEEKTRRSFATHPRTGERLYRTGDKGRWLPDGNIEFLGREDTQVKIQGHRMELGEIEAALERHPGVRSAVVAAVGPERGARRLVAYVVPSGPAPELDEVRSFLRARLPEPMVPSALVVLPELPLTANGKVDRKALPAPDAPPGTGAGPDVSRTPVEELLAGIWSHLLGVDSCGPGDSFFDLGGDSLLAVHLVTRLREAFQVEIPLRNVFERPTLAELGREVEALGMAGLQAQAPPIRKASGDVRPLSFAQQRLWLLDRLEPWNFAYNIPSAIRIQGELSVPVLERSLGEVVGRHEVLRSTFPFTDGEPRAVIAAAGPLTLPLLDLGALDGTAQSRELRRLAAEEARRLFSLENGPVLRFSLVRLAPQEHVFLLTLHHIVSDATSMAVLFREVAALYEAFSAGRPSPLPELPVQYGDFAAWQRQWLQGPALHAELGYWKERLAGAPAALDLPADRPRSAVQSYRGASRSVRFGRDLSAAVARLGRSEGSTLFMTALAAFSALLYRYTGQADVSVGTVIDGRSRRELESLIGFFVNTLVLRTSFAGDLSFRDLLARSREAALGAYSHQNLPFEKLVEELQPRRDLARTPLFQVMIVLQNAPLRELEASGSRFSAFSPGGEAAQFDLTLRLELAGDELGATMEYRSGLFDPTTILRMLGHLEALLRSVGADPSLALDRIPLASPAEIHQRTREWNDTAGAPETALCLHELFAAQARRTPERVALIHGGESLTYADLHRRSNQVARHLRSLGDVGVGPESVVGLCMDRSPEMVVAALGILKAGGAYLPLDPAWPRERLAFMLEDSEAEVLLTRGQAAAGLPQGTALVVRLDDLDARSPEDLPAASGPGNLAYVIYTSGSTGRPKGVMIEHRSAVTLVRWAQEVFSSEDLARVLASTSICFDLSVFELFVPLSTGGAVVLVENALDLKTVAPAGVTLLNTVPSILSELLHADSLPSSLRVVNLAGEPLPRVLAERLRASGRAGRLYNLYGPSEDTTYSTGARISWDDEGEPPIGRPILDTSLHLLDAAGSPVPVGVAGELFLGGAGLARGYLRRPDLTAERFVPDPFSDRPGERLYRTGDLARHLPDGRALFLGRADQQVKVRGFRIELGEIEAALAAHPGVRECAVKAWEQPGSGLRLVAYVVAEPGAAPGDDELRASLADRLPASMLPSLFVTLPALPATPSGKVDRRALPPPGPGRAGRQDSVLPRDAVELELAHLWEELLGVHPVGVRDNFFSLGGHSLLAVRLMSRIRNRFGRELPPTLLFQEGTIEHLARRLRQAGDGPARLSPLVAIREEGDRTPLFCVHPAGGGVLAYRDLAELLGDDQPVYGLQATTPGSVPEIAGRYLEAILERQPSGPFRIAGWSFGGLVAYEIARRLEEAGQDVGLLVLFDTFRPAPGGPEPDDADILAELFDADRSSTAAEIRAQGSLERQIAYLLERFGNTSNLLPGDVDPASLRRHFEVYRGNVLAGLRYSPRPISGRLCLFRATERPAGAGETDPGLGWSDLVRGGIEVYDVPGRHSRLLRRPAVEVVADHLRTCLDRVEVKA
ncbi:MAG: amino acid adenylation domain-containing protein [Acidobacteriota bacterium]